MPRPIPPIPAAALLTILITALSVGCAGTPPARHFLLEATAAIGQPTPGPRQTPAVIIDSVQLADYLNRLPIVRRTGDSRLGFDDGIRWAEPLELGFRRVLADNLDRLFGAATVVPSTKAAKSGHSYRLTIEVSRFDIDADRRAVLDARWSLLPGNGKDGVVRRSQLSLPVAGADTAAEVEALNRLLADYAAEVKQVLRQMP